jgi:hypothetical protein
LVAQNANEPINPRAHIHPGSLTEPPQHPEFSCNGGHGASPNEQKTQQSPFFGFIKYPHPLQA